MAAEALKSKVFLGGRALDPGDRVGLRAPLRNARVGPLRRGVSTAPKETKETPTPAAPAAGPAGPTAEKVAKKEKGPKGRDAKEPKEAKEPKAKARPGTGKAQQFVSNNPNFRYIVRVANTDLDGTRPVTLALTGVRGIGLRLSEVACRLSNVSGSALLGDLPEPTVDGLEAKLTSLNTNVPRWMVNHPTEPFAGESPHYIGADLETRRRDDVNVMRMVRSYRGVRHERGQKVRGQRTRSNGRTGMAAGVLKKAAKEAAQAKEATATAAAK